jgi:peptidoglycan/xylan/chitin deacetylase (PgdA/CDA1 family)
MNIQMYFRRTNTPVSEKPPPRKDMKVKRRILEGLAWIAWGSGITLAVRKVLWRDRVAILVYHDPQPDVLDAHLSYLKRICEVTTLSDLHRDGHGRARAVVTLDDGHRGNAALLPVFRKHGIRPTIFVCSGIVAQPREFWWMSRGIAQPDIESLQRLPDADRMSKLASAGYADNAEAEPTGLDAREIDLMRPHVDFESHTRFHPVLTRCGDDRCLDEIAGSKSEVEALTGQRCEHFAYPNGSYGAREVAMLQASGYRAARTCDAGWNDRRTDPFRLRAFEISDTATVRWFAVQLTGLPAYLHNLRGGGGFRGCRAPF